MEADDGLEEEGPFSPWVPPDDRLWRHPSEFDLVRARASGTSHTLSASLSNTLARTWTVAIVAGIVGAMAASGVGFLTGVFDQARSTIVDPTLASEPTMTPITGPTAVDWNGVDENVAPAVVSISVSTPSGPAAASGVMLEGSGKEAYVLTDASVLADGGSVLVGFLSGAQVSGRIVGTDPLSGLAVVAVPDEAPYFPTIGSVANLQDADPVLAVGARTSTGGSVFAGAVSGEDREVSVSGGATMENLIAVTTSSLPSTAAGGPLVDRSGQVVGITLDLNPIDPADQSLTFAVPIDVAQSVADQLLAGDCCSHPWMGVSNGVTVPPVDAHRLGVAGGVLVGDVTPGSPAYHIGLAQNDIITALGGRPVTSAGVFTKLIGQYRPGIATDVAYMTPYGKRLHGHLVMGSQPVADPDDS